MFSILWNSWIESKLIYLSELEMLRVSKELYSPTENKDWEIFENGTPSTPLNILFVDEYKETIMVRWKMS